MSDETPQGWLSVYLYYNEPWEEFLKEAVRPIVETVIKNGIADQFFFIRYWDRGAHVRLRFKGGLEVMNDILKPNLTDHFQSYYESKPSRRIDPHFPVEFPEDFKWWPNNSLRYVDYEPETGRYGGEVGMSLSEKQFQASSAYVLEEIQRIGNKWSYEDAMGTAIKMHLSFIYLMGLDKTAVKNFFSQLYANWSPHTFHLHRKLTETESEDISIETLETFKLNFDKQKDALIPFVNTLWTGLDSGDLFEDDHFNEWIGNCKLFKHELNHAFNQGKLEKRKGQFLFSSNKELSQKSKLFYGLFIDYIHMTNNRLGILNRDEGYLAYLILHSLDHNSNNNSLKMAAVG